MQFRIHKPIYSSLPLNLRDFSTQDLIKTWLAKNRRPFVLRATLLPMTVLFVIVLGLSSLFS